MDLATLDERIDRLTTERDSYVQQYQQNQQQAVQLQTLIVKYEGALDEAKWLREQMEATESDHPPLALVD